MAIYRESRSTRRFIPIAAAIGIAFVLMALAVVVLTTGNNTNNANSPQLPTDNSLTNGAGLDKIATSLDLFQIEYMKVSAGTAPAQTGAPGAITTAINALSASLGLPKLNKVAYIDLQTDLGTLNAALHTSLPPDMKKVMADAEKQLQTLRTANTTATAAVTR